MHSLIRRDHFGKIYLVECETSSNFARLRNHRPTKAERKQGFAKVTDRQLGEFLAKGFRVNSARIRVFLPSRSK